MNRKDFRPNDNTTSSSKKYTGHLSGTEYEMQTQYDSSKSFYGKAKVRNENGKIILHSYNTDVAYIENGRAVVTNTQSPTTVRHIKEFLKQHGYKAETKGQIEKDYGYSYMSAHERIFALSTGRMVEMSEHPQLTKEEAEHIAIQHLEENPHYYTKHHSSDNVSKALRHKDILGEGSKKRKHLKDSEKVEAVMKEYKRGTLYSGSGRKVKSRKQAIAIAMSEQRKSEK